ncbi:MAG: pilus assembly protein TadG-related protein [Thiobacillus sp.]
MSQYIQRGQALPLALVLLVAVAATVFFMFNSGQLVQEKIRLTNTADAVAYSAGVYEARVLNYDAYTNRAIIANEIAIGQAVGLASWAKYAGTAADNVSPYMYLIPYAGAAIANALEEVRDAMDLYTPMLAYTVPLHDAAINSLAASQMAVHGPGNAVALVNRKAVMDEVAKKNDPDAKVDLLPLADNFYGFTQRYSSKEERVRMGQVVSDGRDAFLKSRNWNFGLVILCTGVQLRKRGSTELIDLTEGWKSMDTLSAHAYSLKISWSGIKCKRSETPIGYGTAFSTDDLDDDDYSYAGSRSTNPNASGKADSDEGIANGFDPAPYSIGGGAIPAFHELSESALKQDDPRTQITIRVTKSSGKQRYSGGNSIIKPSGSLDLYQGDHANGLSASIARAEVYFERPDGPSPLFSGKAEKGSLFNPYWQVRLVPVSAAERALAQLKQGLALP